MSAPAQPGRAMGDKLPGMASNRAHHPNYYNQLIILSVVWTAADGQVRVTRSLLQM